MKIKRRLFTTWPEVRILSSSVHLSRLRSVCGRQCDRQTWLNAFLRRCLQGALRARQSADHYRSRRREQAVRRIARCHTIVSEHARHYVKRTCASRSWMACRLGLFDMVKLLLRTKSVDVERPNRYGVTPLQAARIAGNVDILGLLDATAVPVGSKRSLPLLSPSPS